MTGTNNVWINFVMSNGTDDDWDYLVAVNNPGATFVGPFNRFQTTGNEGFPEVYADPIGKYLHMVWVVDNHTIKYVTTSPDFLNWKLGFNENGLLVNRGGLASWDYPSKGLATDWKFGFAGCAWLDYSYSGNSRYAPFFNRLVPDDLMATWDGQGVYFRTDGNNWIYLGAPAEQAAAGDLDGDGTADVLAVYSAQGGLFARKSTDNSWVLVGTTPRDIAAGNVTGTTTDMVLGTWDGQGVYYKNGLAGAWVQMATPATMIAAGDLDGDGKADLLGVWPSQAGVWVKYSQTGTWAYLGSTPTHIAAGDMNGDGKDELVGTWDGQGCYWRENGTGTWHYLASPATKITTGDLDGDGIDDLIGIWPSQAGVWVKYSSNGAWEYIGSTPRDISSGKMRGGTHTWGASMVGLPEPVGGQVDVAQGHVRDLSNNSPGRPGFTCLKQDNLVPVQDARFQVVPGPGMPGFKFVDDKNTIPGAGLRRGKQY